MGLELCPITQKEAFAFVERHHRHHKPPAGSIFQIGLSLDGEIVGVAIVCRPAARMLQDGWTAEVARMATDGSRNACSMLYGACWRACRAMGYRRLITYTLPEEGGAHLEELAGAALAQLGGDPGLASLGQGSTCIHCKSK